MGQVALGLRSLMIRLAIFVVMAALLAWALGGTLLPRAESAEVRPVTMGSWTCFWRLEVGGRAPERVRWRLFGRAPGQDEEAMPLDARVFAEAAGPLSTPDGVYFAGRAHEASDWYLARVESGAEGGPVVQPVATLPDRLAVEVELERLRSAMATTD